MNKTYFPVFAPRLSAVEGGGEYNGRLLEQCTRLTTFAGEGTLELDAPLGLCAVHFEHTDTHDEDDDRGNELEDTCGATQRGKSWRVWEDVTLPKRLGLGPQVARLGKPHGDERGTDGEGNEEAEERAGKDVYAHLAEDTLGVQLVGFRFLDRGEFWRGRETFIGVGAAGLLMWRALVLCWRRCGRGGRDAAGEEGGVLVDDLLDKTEEDGDDDGGLEGLTEDNEEDGDGEDVPRHSVSLGVLSGRGTRRRSREGEGT